MPRVPILIIDEVLDSHLKPRPAYWFARLPRAEMEELNPRGYGAYRHKPTEKRIGVLIGLPGMGLLLIFAYLYLTLQRLGTMELSTVITQSFMIAALGGFAIGVPLALLINRLFLKTELLYVAGRVEASLAPALGLFVPDGAAYALVWATPPPLMDQATKEEAEAMARESQTSIWQFESLLRGVDGWATDKYLQGMASSVKREDTRWGGGIRNILSHDRTPAGSSSPNGSRE